MAAAVWITREGDRLPMAEMGDRHLIAAIDLIRRRTASAARRIAYRQALQALTYASDAPDGAAMAAESEAFALLDGEYTDHIIAEEMPVFAALLSEAARRGMRQ